MVENARKCAKHCINTPYKNEKIKPNQVSLCMHIRVITLIMISSTQSDGFTALQKSTHVLMHLTQCAFTEFLFLEHQQRHIISPKVPPGLAK